MGAEDAYRARAKCPVSGLWAILSSSSLGQVKKGSCTHRHANTSQHEETQSVSPRATGWGSMDITDLNAIEVQQWIVSYADSRVQGQPGKDFLVAWPTLWS